MEGSDAETGMVDCGVGTIVWVRRRNGSWWPGKILGPVELSASHLMSPRSGTPVKLLGREDASVDWYNLEKSKRVKPFRCGEFDDCIERAEASQGMPPKKREKYARREDAILHALELEKQLLEKKYGKSGVQSSAKFPGKDTIVTAAETSCDNDKHENTKMDPSLEEGLLFPAQSGSQLNVDDKSTDVRPRLRGLQDLGVGGPISFKYNLSSFADANGSHKHADAADEVLHNLTPESRIPVGRKKILEKRKRSQEGNNIEETLNKRRDRRRPLVQVLKSSAKFPHIDPLQSHADGGSLHLGEEQTDMAIAASGIRVKSVDSFDYTQTLPDQVEISTPKFEENPVGLNEENNTTGSNEDTETDSSGTESLISDTYDAMAALLDEGEEDIEFIPKAFGIGRSEAQGEDESASDESGLPDDSGDSLPLQNNTTVSKWQLKGKRNSRRYTERKAVSTSSMNAAVWMKDNVHMGPPSRGGWEDHNPESCLVVVGGGGGYYHDPPPVSIVSSPRQFSGGTGRIKSMLIDVDVGVQSGYQREHVPMISLMSKLNDKAIVGHPIPVETLEDSTSDYILLSASADEESLYDSTLQPWRTARRTAKCRVPRPPHLSTLEEDQEEQHLVDDEDSKANRKSRKLVKRKSSTSSCNQKIRTLSSIGGTHHHQQHQHHHQQQQHSMDLVCYEGEGVMKPESLPTAVACIPVKLVFSRLHEELVARHQ